MSQKNNHNSIREWETWMHNLIIEENIPFYQYSEFVNVNAIGENVYKATFKISQKTIRRHRKLGINDNILKFYGISKQENTNNYMIILEYTNNGYLRQYLKTNFKKLDWNAKLNLAKRISNVLMYLHSNDIIHGRLNSENILIHDENIKLNIFGSTKIMPESLLFLTNTIGPIQYIDPQYLENFSTICKNKNSDIFSLGIILWEISSGSPPFKMESNIDLLDSIVKGKREMIISGTPSKYKELYTDCWNHNRNSRPDISQVTKKFSFLRQNDELNVPDPPFINFSAETEFLKDHVVEELEEVNKKSDQFSDASKYLRSLGKFKEAAITLSNDLNKEENAIDSLYNLLHPCSVNILVDSMNNESNLKELHKLLNDAINTITKVKSESLKKSEKWYRLMEEIQLYSAYLKSDLNRIHKCIQFFQRYNDTVVEFQALSIWLKIPPELINTDYWHGRLQYIMRLCELVYDFIDPHKNVFNKEKINKNFEEIFFIEEVQDYPDKRKISFDNPLVCHIDETHDKNTIENLEGWQVYNVDIVHKGISKFLASYIYDLISEADQEGRNIKDIASEICDENVICKKQNICQKHHVIPTPSIIHKRIALACLQYTVMRQLDLIYRLRLLIEEKSKLVMPKQRFWTERLVDCHFRYKSPQSSCPEITHTATTKLPRHTYDGFVEFSNKVWLGREFDSSNFAKMLRCMFILLQLQYRLGIDKFNRETSHHSYNSMPGFIYTGRYYESVAKRLALFVESLRNNFVIKAINYSKNFINYAIENSDQVNIVKSEAFGDLTSLIEFSMFLILASRPGYCDFCLSRSYLVNYYDSFNLNPSLVSKKLLEAMIYKYKGMYYSTIILRLIRLLVLICLNEPTLTAKNGFDSLVMVFYNWGGMSRFSSWEKPGITKISYNSIEEFCSSLQKIIISFQPAKPAKPANSIKQNFASIFDNGMMMMIVMMMMMMMVIMIVVVIVMTMVMMIQNREKYHQSHYDLILDKIYKAVKLFCQNVDTVRKYNVNLMGLTLSLESLSTTENPGKHKEANIEWLENELEQVKEKFDLVREWIKKCNEL
ncbi:hypothetical protein Glove_79g82 [Diversispora epigaea]|uniref:Protein kinase domain-containing protein n=1 Tax=Diversispora epigaea TaxID=1348612 RepID=A0A397JBW6_9GLOM|nr:hypothetical protein Glove_79g82 [Diversispora epigaea]